MCSVALRAAARFMFSSTIIPTIGRPTLAVAVESVLSQECDEPFEVIVVNDSRKPLEPAAWQSSKHVRVVATEGRERSVARNTGAAIARGRYFHFLDDDDVMLPGALTAFLRASRQVPEAGWLIGAWRTVDNEGRTVQEFRPAIPPNLLPLLVAGEGLPLQASLVRASAFAGAGGFNPRPELTGVEDRELGRRLALTFSAHRVEPVVAQVRIGEVGSSTNWRTIGEGDRLGREQVLQRPETLARILKARPSAFWRGRLARAYLGSAQLNLRWRAVWTSIGRLGQALRLSGTRLFSPSFWRGVGRRDRDGD